MIVDDQRELIEFLSRSSSYSDPGARVERIDTHSAVVFLVGAHAYKLKRAVRYDYLDFSTSDLRRRFCEAEVTLNRRTAPDLYECVVPVTREPDGRLAIAGRGQPVDWLVRMRRFADDQLLDRLAAHGDLSVDMMPPLALAIARLHASAAQRIDKGGAAGMAWVVTGNERGLVEEGLGLFDATYLTPVVAATHRELARVTPLLDRRRAAGWVRVCHGDLHLGNIVLLDGNPVLFDAIEFNDDLSCIDVLYDVAFLVTDLWRLGLRPQANALFNAYLNATFRDAADYEALTLLPLFLSCRSAVRAKTGATASRLQRDAAHAAHLAHAARTCLAEAAEMLHPATPTLLAIGGASGTGKSTVAQRLAPGVGAAPGAVVLRTDVLRKQHVGVPETTRLGAEAYTAAMHARVYAELVRRAEMAVRAGHSVVVDGVFGRVEDRDQIARAAAAAGARFAAVWLQAPRATLEARVAARRGDASDASVGVLAAQLAQMAPAAWVAVEASGTPDAVVDRVREVLALPPS